MVDSLSAYGLLGPDILISNAVNASPSDAEILAKENIFISSTPEGEMQMGLGQPVWNRDDLKSISSLGTDTQTVNSSDIMSQMRLGLQAERSRHNLALIEKGQAPKKLNVSVRDVFRLGTIQGARAVKLQDQIGTLEEGKLADIVIFDGHSPALVCAAEHDPIAAIVLHASTRDIDTVIVDGRIRKRDGKLVPLGIDESIGAIGKSHVEWRDVATQLLRTRERIQIESEKIDYEAAAKTFIGVVGIDEKNIV